MKVCKNFKMNCLENVLKQAKDIQNKEYELKLLDLRNKEKEKELRL